MRVNGLIYYYSCGLLSIFLTHWLFWSEIGRRLGVYHEIYPGREPGRDRTLLMKFEQADRL